MRRSASQPRRRQPWHCTQQIIAEESGVADTVDPIAGSWHVERLTKSVYEEARHLIERIESKGGAMAAIEEGWQQQEIHLSAYQYLTEIEQNKRNIVGVNHGVMEELGEIPVMKTDATLGERQTERLKMLKATRNDDVARSLSRGPAGGGCAGQPVSPRD